MFDTDLLTIEEVPALIPVKVSAVTIRNWIRYGARGRKLRSVTVGGKRFVPRAAIAEFLRQDEGESGNAGVASGSPVPSPPALATA